MKRRDFLTATGGTFLLAGGSSLGVYLLTAPKSRLPHPATSPPERRWGMVIDLNRCRPDCTACLDACRAENNVAFHGDDRWDIHWIRKVKIREKRSKTGVEKPVLLMCNHCERPPCAQVCPVKATFQREDGIVLVDHHRCIGCRYCVMSCPYNARYFNFKENPDWPNKDYPKRSHGVAESCNFCAHLLDRGKDPACLAACREVGANCFTVGNVDDPNSRISRLIARTCPKRIRADLGTEPRVYYVGL